MEKERVFVVLRTECSEDKDHQLTTREYTGTKVETIFRTLDEAKKYVCACYGVDTFDEVDQAEMHKMSYNGHRFFEEDYFIWSIQSVVIN